MLRRFETTTLKGPNEEKKIIAEIKKLKESIPNAEKLVQIKTKLDILYAQRKEINEKMSALRPEIDAKEGQIEAVRKELEDAKEARDDIKEKLDKFEALILIIKEEV